MFFRLLLLLTLFGVCRLFLPTFFLVRGSLDASQDVWLLEAIHEFCRLVEFEQGYVRHFFTPRASLLTRHVVIVPQSTTLERLRPYYGTSYVLAGC